MTLLSSIVRSCTFGAALFAACAVRLSAPAGALDSQDVLLHYERALIALPTPKTMVFTYTVSQAGPRALEQMHRIYRSGDLVRDEMIASEGQTLKRKTVRVSRYPDRYAIARIAPHGSEYAFLFQGMVRIGSRTAYEYTAVPTQRGGAYVVDSMAIDTASFLPLSIRFSTVTGNVKAQGELRYARTARYWLPQFAAVQAQLAGGIARERIAFSGYSFPESLPKSTFRSLKPQPTPAALPTF